MVEFVAHESAREIVRRLLQRQGSPSAFSELWERWLAREQSTMETFWHASFSRVLGALPREDLHSVAAESIGLAVHLGECGEPGAWNSSCSSLASYSWGAWQLPACDRVAVESDGSIARLKLAAPGKDHRIVFSRRGSEWLLDSGNAAALTRVGMGKPKVALLPRNSNDLPRSHSLPGWVENVTSEIEMRWKETFRFLRSFAPSYLPWIQQAVRGIGVLNATDGKVYSASFSESCGVIHASALASVPSSAEMLVHEAAHQYFLLISRLGPVDDGTDAALYYSPLVGRERPLNRVLFAFHACANILAYYRMCQAAGAPDQDYFARNESVVVDQLKQLSAPLRGNHALTTVGKALFEPWQDIAS